MSDILNEAIETISHTTDNQTEQGVVNTPTADDLVTSFFRAPANDMSATDRNRINDIAEYLEMETTESDQLHKEMDKVNILREIKNNLGIPSMGISHLEHMHNYIKIKMAILKNNAKLRAMEG
jgi:hypothetical protein